MEPTRYLDCLATDYGLFRAAVVAASLSDPVPSCPEWTVADLLTHVGEVYLHKTAVLRDGKWPDQWPSEEHASVAPLALLDQGYRELTAEFAARPADEPAWTWFGPEQTVGFWIRRMAQETVVHRMDAQLGAGEPLSVAPDDLAVDGVDEVLKRFLEWGAAEWPEEYATVEGGHLAGADGTAAVVVTAGPASWTVRPAPTAVSVEDGGGEAPRAVVSATPDDMLRWLWGRADDSVITVTGDPEWAAYLRRLLAAVTG